MAFILAADGRDTDITAIVGLFQRYQDYLRSVEDGFPAGAFALATSDWYFNFNDHRCPHDAWLEAAELGEHSAGLRDEIRSPYLKLRLLGAYRDGLIGLHYPRLMSYRFHGSGINRGHGDWRYDELRLSETGNLIHEIEWSDGAHWLIEAANIEFEWLPIAARGGT